jgi:hypothetical protein
MCIKWRMAKLKHKSRSLLAEVMPKIRIGAKITKSQRPQIKLQHVNGSRVNGSRVNGLWTDKNV